MNDLGTSGFQISASDIKKKSNPKAKLCSYRMSVPATLLEKALDPGSKYLNSFITVTDISSIKIMKEQDNLQLLMIGASGSYPSGL